MWRVSWCEPQVSALCAPRGHSRPAGHGRTSRVDFSTSQSRRHSSSHYFRITVQSSDEACSFQQSCTGDLAAAAHLTALGKAVASHRRHKITRSESGTPTRSTWQRPFFLSVSLCRTACFRMGSPLTPDALQDPYGCLVEMTGHEYAIHCLVSLGEER